VARLSKEEVMTIAVLRKTGESQRAIARRLRVDEKSVRYHLGRQKAGGEDGRRKKRSLISVLALEPVVEQWWTTQREDLGERRPNVEALRDFLVAEYGYPGSVKSVRKYVRAHFPAPRLRAFRRVETPPGAQAQVDWSEHPGMDIGDAAGPVTLYAFHLRLSHSRAAAVIWCRSMDQVSWHHAHNEAFRRIGGVPAVLRIDNLKTGIGQGAGPWGTVNASYATYARALGFHVDACLPRCPQQKGKVERGVRTLRDSGLTRGCFASLAHLQAWTDAKLAEARSRQRCPATGTAVAEAWEVERRLLRELPALLPEPFDVVATRVVSRDCQVAFEGRFYPVPFAHVGLPVEVRGCAGVVQIVDPVTGVVLRSHPRHTAARIISDPTCYDGEATERILPPVPLGAMGKRLEELARRDTPRRSIAYYAELAEVAR
jgi:transposase